MRNLFIKLIFFPFVLFSQDSFLQMDAGYVTFDGAEFVCRENVCFQTDFGTLRAEFVKTNEALSWILLNNHVELNLSEEEKFVCNEAEVFPFERKLNLRGQVIFSCYRELSVNSSVNCKKDLFFQLMGEKVLVELIQDTLQLKHFYIEDQVQFEYQNELFMKANHASVLFLDCEHESPYLITLEGQCELRDLHGNSLIANKIQFNLVENSLIIYDIDGRVRFERMGASAEILRLSAKTLIWDREREEILLKKNISVELLDFGEFRVKDEMLLTYDLENGKKKLKSVECLGGSELYLKCLQSSLYSQFICPGKLVVDNCKKQMVMRKNYETNEQVVFHDTLAKVRADAILVSYAISEKKSFLDKVEFEGGVQLASYRAFGCDVHRQMQYAIADKVEYLPNSKELNFYAYFSNRVLFLDVVNHFQISAPGLRMKRSTAVQRGYIQGVGDVRFSFIKKESDLMQKFLENGLS